MTVTNLGAGRGFGPVGSPLPPAIELNGVHKSFGPVQAVKGIDLSVESGEIVAFLGPNGAGKTSTIDVILGLSHPTAGLVARYLLNNTPATDIEITTRGLEDAFIALTSDDTDGNSTGGA